MQRLRTMIAVLVLRRTKEDIASTLKLPDKIINTHTLDLGMEEQNIYDALFTEARSHSHVPIPPFQLIPSFSPLPPLPPHPLYHRKVFVSWLAEKRGEGEETDSPAKTNSTGNTSPPVLLPPPVQHCLDNILASFSVGRGAVLVMLLRSAPLTSPLSVFCFRAFTIGFFSRLDPLCSSLHVYKCKWCDCLSG